MLGALSFLIFFGALLYDDHFLFRSNSRNDLAVIGKIQISNKDVRKKNMDQFFWQPAVLDDQISDEDSVFTGENSSVEIALNDGSKIELQENSLVQVRMKNNQVNLNLQDGWIKTSVKHGQSLVLEQDGKEMVVTSDGKGEVKIKKSRTGELDIIVEKGNAKINNVRAEANKPVVVENGLVKMQTKVQLYLEQTPKRAIELAEGERPEIKFSIYGPATGSQLKFISTSNADQSFYVPIANNLHPNWPQKIASGSYKVQLLAKAPSGENIYSNSRELQIVQILTPKLLDMQSVYSAILKPNLLGQLEKDIQIRWSNDPNAKSYILELSQGSQTNISQSFIIESSSITFPKMKTGSYWVRLRAQGQSKQSPWSSTTPFQVALESEESYRPGSPILGRNDIDFSPQTDANGEFTEQGPVLRWTPAPSTNPQATKNLEYKVQISSFEDFRSASEIKIFEKEFFEWKKYQKGQYFFRIYAQNSMGLISAPSQTGRLNIQFQGINLKPVEPIQQSVRSLASVLPTAVQLQWSKAARTSKYQVEISTDNEFTNPRRIETNNNATSLNLNPGKYYARVSGFDEQGVDLKITSNVQTIEYDVMLPLEKPQLIEPKSNATVFLQDISKPYIAVRWTPVVGAHSYVVEVAADPDFLQILKSVESKLSKAIISERLPFGPLYWRVKAFSKLKRQIANVKNAEEYSNWSDQRTFQIGHGDASLFEKE